MDIGQAIWIFFLLTALQPVVKQRLLESSRMRLLAQIERRRESRVILLVHRQETMSLLGFPLMRYIDVNDAENVMRACEMTDPEMPLRSEEHTSELQSPCNLVCRLLLEKKKPHETLR